LPVPALPVSSTIGAPPSNALRAAFAGSKAGDEGEGAGGRVMRLFTLFDANSATALP
jgi:hypothetical protein